ncbi:MAG: hypothetical protein AB2693_31055 [Candidatus Thiodiazotropha sp.]
MPAVEQAARERVMANTGARRQEGEWSGQAIDTPPGNSRPFARGSKG